LRLSRFASSLNSSSIISRRSSHGSRFSIAGLASADLPLRDEYKVEPASSQPGDCQLPTIGKSIKVADHATEENEFVFDAGLAELLRH